MFEQEGWSPKRHLQTKDKTTYTPEKLTKEDIKEARKAFNNKPLKCPHCEARFRSVYARHLHVEESH